jgi:hypothetical protein
MSKIPIFNINITTNFRITNFILNTPININTIDNKYLSCAEFYNIVDFFNIDDDSNRQKWIIEKDNNIYYIKSAFNRYNFTQYLGCPNSNNQVFLYTSKNRFTKWIINHLHDDIYNIIYDGDKFDNKVSIVIARYKEDIEWALAYNDIAIIYNKGDNINLPFNKIIKLQNIGREGHTYLYHIIKNYNNLSDRTIFTQGSPFEHNNTILFGIDNFEKTMNVQPLGLQYIKELNIPSSEIIEKYKIITNYGLEYLVIHIDENCFAIDPYYFKDYGIDNLNNSYRNRFINCESLVDNFLLRSKIKINKNTKEIRFTFCGLFSVIKRNIKRHNITIYKKLIKELTSYSPQGGDNGYILERLWLYIFE